MFKFLCAFAVLFSIFHLINCEDVDCQQEPVQLNADFIGCCSGKPTFTSEPCIDALLENKTFSQECVVDCMYKDFKIYDGKSIDMEGVKVFFNSNVSEVPMRELYVNAYEWCTKIDKAELQQLFAFVEMANEHNCDVFPAFMDTCVWYHTVGNCPDKYASTDEQCAAKINWVQECLLK